MNLQNSSRESYWAMTNWELGEEEELDMKHRIESGKPGRGRARRGSRIHGNTSPLWKISAVLGEQVKEQSGSPGSGHSDWQLFSRRPELLRLLLSAAEDPRPDPGKGLVGGEQRRALIAD